VKNLRLAKKFILTCLVRANYSVQNQPCQVKNLPMLPANVKNYVDRPPLSLYKRRVRREREMTETNKTKSSLLKKFLTYIAQFGKTNHQDGRENEMTKIVEKNYTDAQEARMSEFDVIDNDTALELAAEFGKDVRSVRAKAVRMGIYKAKEKVSKTGGKVESKEAIVQDIADLVGRNLDGLEKAPKQVLIELRSKLAA
jgi:hypothetical protein